MTQFDKIINKAKRDFEGKVDTNKLVDYLTYAKNNCSYKVFEHVDGFYVSPNGDKLTADDYNYEEIIKEAIEDQLVNNDADEQGFTDYIESSLESDNDFTYQEGQDD